MTPCDRNAPEACLLRIFAGVASLLHFEDALIEIWPFGALLSPARDAMDFPLEIRGALGGFAAPFSACVRR